MTVVTRFAPSPTGFLHIGGARTALFNWLYARRHGGTFLLRIEDTDRQRSTDAAVDAILDGLSWLGLEWDGDAVSQFARKDRHAEVANEMLRQGRAYHCYASPAELEEMRAAQKAAGQPVRYDGRWRDRDPSEAPAGVAPVIRLKVPQEGETLLRDHVQGEVRVQNAQLDDLILLRADGTPTYLLAVVVDDHDMGVTHVIRGDDHLTNTFRQIQIYNAMGWSLPEFAHIPLIHGPDGAKLSKRHGALGVDAYRDMGYLPEAVRNYLLRLGWAHGDDEIISTDQATEWFNLEGIGRSPSRFDFAKLENLNGHYMRMADDARLVDLIVPRLESELGRNLSDDERARLLRSMNGLKQRAKTVVELAASARFLVAARPLPLDAKAAALLDGNGRALLADLAALLAETADFTASAIEGAVRQFAEGRGEKLGKAAQPLRAALTGSTVSPPIFEVAEILGRTETLARMQDALR
ncbi:glutamate--tRNA ligase [Azospirillum sp. RWY-5-1]|uniref:Glutamate--tRNA ligase n=1 Tax=Azospirillum oleiclasticum TaxID=2735135 RepID=A0ABX2TJQ6_9PROT|nr:glutamate--tRNA ligase [Azospirillum oleiclasticum]NYZ16970.1 glutamate--tRNA ligase [Azospirillum oleiclasticum]NYZ24587.1 glutamate--tRNA ligase [Azospirillum oleiclasticum]